MDESHKEIRHKVEPNTWVVWPPGKSRPEVHAAFEKARADLKIQATQIELEGRDND